MPYTIVNGQMVDTPVGYNPAQFNPYQAQAGVAATGPGALPGMNAWDSRNIAANAQNPWGYQYDPRFQNNSTYDQNTQYGDWVSQITGSQPQYRGPAGNFGSVAQQYNAGQPLMPQTAGGQAQMGQNMGVPAPAPAPAPGPTAVGGRGQAPGQMPQQAPPPTATGGRSTPGGTSNSGQTPQNGVAGQQQPQGGLPPNPIQQLQQTGYGVPFSPQFVPPQAFGQQQGGLDIMQILQSVLGNMGGGGQQFAGPGGSTGMGAPGGGYFGQGGGLQAQGGGPQSLSAPQGGFGGLGGMALGSNGMAQGVGPQAPNLTALLLQLLGGGR